MSDVSRRGFLKRLAGAGTVLLLAAMGKIYFTTTPGRRRKTHWVDVGALTAFPEGKPVKIQTKADVPFTYRNKTFTFTTWIVNRNGNFIAYDPYCTHHECYYTWEEKNTRFFCPCHGGAFDVKGEVLSGPAPHALYRYPVKVEGDRLLVEFEV